MTDIHTKDVTAFVIQTNTDS